MVSCFCGSPVQGRAVRCLRLAHLAHLPSEEFQDKEGRVAGHAWLVEAVAEQRSAPRGSRN